MVEHTKNHIPVLLRETLQGLALTPDRTVIDATLGSGGHFSAILSELGKRGTLLGIDADSTAIAQAQERFKPHTHSPRVLFATDNFRNITKIAKEQGITSVHAIVADLGWRSEQFLGDKKSGGGKGFSFAIEEPLLMTFGDPVSYAFTARDIINSWREDDLVNVLKGYGEERYAQSIAHAIVVRRETRPIKTSAELAEIVNSAVPSRYQHGRIHPATKTFQALRIAVNDELEALQEFIESASTFLSSDGRLAVISFHSIEDRIVKHTMRALETEGRVRRITKKPITPTNEEIQANPRSRSAKLRIIEKI